MERQEEIMSYKTKMILPILGLVLTIGYAGIRVARSDAEEVKHALPAALGSLAEVKRVEVKDADGQVVLSGDFGGSKVGGKEIERKAALAGTSLAPEARGKAEIEFSAEGSGADERELEMKVERLAAGATFRLFVDGQEVASFVTNHRGEAEVELSNEAPQ
jgi:hypothetical protein